MGSFMYQEDKETAPSDILKCPFLRNINEPTNFSLSSMAFSVPMHGMRGPIFEDGPNFDLAFKLFHGRDGVVPLTRRSSTSPVGIAQSSPPLFNPLAAKAATISLSAFGGGGPFGFDAFSEKWKKLNRNSNSSKKESSSKKEGKGKGKRKGESANHGALSNEWLATGNCPIAKSYRAVTQVVPLVARALQPPPNMNLKCPAAIVAARAALARTSFARNLRPQPLPEKVLAIGILGMAANIPLGIWREHTRKFSPSWFAAVHAAVPFIAMLRKTVLMPKPAMAFTIAASVLGQMIGSRAERFRLRRGTESKTLESESKSLESESGGFGRDMGEVEMIRGVGCCGGTVDWKPLMTVNPTGSSCPA